MSIALDIVIVLERSRQWCYAEARDDPIVNAMGRR
jgi:hypothetical protein